LVKFFKAFVIVENFQCGLEERRFSKLLLEPFGFRCHEFVDIAFGNSRWGGNANNAFFDAEDDALHMGLSGDLVIHN